MKQMHKVIKEFTDNQDKGHPYKVGDLFPRDGLEVSQERINQLATSNNLQGVPLIVKEELAKINEVLEKANVEDIVEVVEKQVKKKKK